MLSVARLHLFIYFILFVPLEIIPMVFKNKNLYYYLC